MARLQSSCNGMRLVLGTSLDRRNMCLLDDPLHLAQFPKSAQLYAGQLWHQHERLCLFLFILATVFASHLVPCSQDSASLHRQGLLCSDCWCCILHLGYCPGKGKLCELRFEIKTF